MKAYERLINYAKVSTASEEGIGVSPSTQRQFDLARMLVEELRGLGVADAELTDTCYVYGHLPATPGRESAPCLGFIAHMDTCLLYTSLALVDDGGHRVVIGRYIGELAPLLLKLLEIEYGHFLFGH